MTESRDFPTCATCRFWAPGQLRECDNFLVDENGENVLMPKDDPRWHSERQLLPAPGEWGACNRVAMLHPTADVAFVVKDGSDYLANLNTRSDFGCVAWVGGPCGSEHEWNGDKYWQRCQRCRRTRQVR